MFRIFLGPPSRRFLKKCEKEVYDRLMKRIKQLAVDPFPSDSKRVVSKKKEKVFRVRAGDYRIQYIVYYGKNEILISDIDKKPRAY